MQLSSGTLRKIGWLREGYRQPPDAGTSLRVLIMLVHVALQRVSSQSVGCVVTRIIVLTLSIGDVPIRVSPNDRD